LAYVNDRTQAIEALLGGEVWADYYQSYFAEAAAYVEANGFSVVRDYVGHGVGAKLHEAPEVRNFGPAGHGPRLLPGMTLAVEPMVNVGDWQIRVLPDGWTVKTLDGSLAAHYENTILITEGDAEVLTVTEDGAYV